MPFFVSVSMVGLVCLAVAVGGAVWVAVCPHGRLAVPGAGRVGRKGSWPWCAEARYSPIGTAFG